MNKLLAFISVMVLLALPFGLADQPEFGHNPNNIFWNIPIEGSPTWLSQVHHEHRINLNRDGSALRLYGVNPYITLMHEQNDIGFYIQMRENDFRIGQHSVGWAFLIERDGHGSDRIRLNRDVRIESGKSLCFGSDCRDTWPEVTCGGLEEGEDKQFSRSCTYSCSCGKSTCTCSGTSKIRMVCLDNALVPHWNGGTWSSCS